MMDLADSILLRPAAVADVPQIAAMERRAEMRDFVGQWSEERHLQTLSNSDARYFVSESAPGELQAYAILRGIGEASRSIELKRVVVASPGRGLGRRILHELMRIAFEDFSAHRLFLDVFEDNARARHVYESLGFVYEGVMREAGERGEQFISLHLMSILDREYRPAPFLTPTTTPPV
jgi:RimJ/RimL family protein N-acetyltransferase